MAVLQAWPGRGFWQGTTHGQPGTLAGMTQSMAPTPQPHVLSAWITAFTAFDEAHGFAVNLFAVAALAVIGAVFLTGQPRLIRPAVIAFGVLCLADWVLIEDTGMFGGLGTDPNSMIPMALLAAAGYLALARAPAPAAEPARAAVPAVSWPDRLRAAATPRSLASASIRSVASAGAIGLIILGAAPMAAAQASPVADPILAQAIDGSSAPVNYPAPAFSLTDQHGRTVTPASLRGKVVLLTFLDPVCTSDCPLEAQEFRLAGQLLGAQARHVELVAINANPGRLPGGLHPGVRPAGAPHRHRELAVPDRQPGPAPPGLGQVRHYRADRARRVDDRAQRGRLRHRPERPRPAGNELQPRAGNRGHEVLLRRGTRRRRTAAAGAPVNRSARRRPIALTAAVAGAMLAAGCGTAAPPAPQQAAGPCRARCH